MYQEKLISAFHKYFKKSGLAILFLGPLFCFAQQRVFVTNDRTKPVPVVVTNTPNGNQSAAIPYKRNVKAVDVVELIDSKANYMWCIEYIGCFIAANNFQYVLIEIWTPKADGGWDIPFTVRLPPGVLLGGNQSISFPTKLRLSHGEKLRILAVPNGGTVNRADIHISGVYEPIPR